MSPHEVRQDDPREIEPGVRVDADADALLGRVRELEREDPRDPLPGELHPEGVLLSRREGGEDADERLPGGELDRLPGGERPASGRPETDERIAVDEVTQSVLPVLAPLEPETERVGHVIGVPDNLAPDLEAEVADSRFAVKLGAGEDPRCGHRKEGRRNDSYDTLSHGAYRLTRTPMEPLRCQRSVDRDERKVKGDWISRTRATLRKGKNSMSTEGSTP